MIGKTVRTLLGGLLIAGIVHVMAILLVPEYAPHDPFDRVIAAASPREVTVIPADGSVLPDLDPFFAHGACLFDLEEGAFQLVADMPDTVWTVAVVAGNLGIVAAFERGAAVDGRLDLIVGRTSDVERLRLSRAGSGETTSYVDAPDDSGFVLLRAYGPSAEARAALTATLRQASCAVIDPNGG